MLNLSFNQLTLNKLVFSKWIAAFVLFFTLNNVSQAGAVILPDFTELAEKHGAEVVNISVTQVAQSGGAQFPFPGMEDDENLQEFFKRFGIPGMPGVQAGAAWARI